MTPERLIEYLLSETGAARRENLLQQAVSMPESLLILMERAQEVLASDPAEALRRADMAAVLSARQRDFRANANAWRLRAQGLLALGRHADALGAAQRAAESARLVGDVGLEAQVRVSEVVALGWMGHAEEARSLGARLIAELRAVGADSEAARILVNLGILHYRQDEYAAALDCYSQASEVFRTQEDAVSLARTQVNEANALTALGRVEEAITHLTQAREVFVAGDMAAFAATAEINLGFLHYVSGHYALALALFDRARSTFSRIRDEEGCAQCDLDSGDAYRALNLIPEAQECYDRAARAFESQQADYDQARAELGRAAACAAVRQTEEAFASLERAERIFEAQGNAVQRAFALLQCASLLLSSGQEAEALRQAAQAERVFGRRGLRGWSAEARFLRLEHALAQGEDATRRMQALIRVARKYGRGRLEYRAENALGRYFAERGESTRALRHFRAGVAALEQARAQIAPEEMHVAFLRDKASLYEDLLGALLARGRKQDIAEALEVVERSRSRLLLERIQSALETSETSEKVPQEDSSTRQRVAELRAALSRKYYQLQNTHPDDPQRRLGTEGQAPEELEQTERAYQAAVRAVELAESAEGRGLFAFPSSVTVAEVQNALRPEETLIEFAIVRGQISAFILTRQKITLCRAVAQEAEVQAANRRLRYQLQRVTIGAEFAARYADGLNAEVREALRTLYDLLLKPLAAHLETESVLVSPTGFLHELPFHAFLDGEQFALDRWEFAYTPSAAIRVAQARENAFGKKTWTPQREAAPVLLMGVPDAGIAKVEAEVAQLAALWSNAQTFCGAEATEARFRAHAPPARLIHLATHAHFRADNPLFSGLQFADGRLLARDLYGMRLDCDLATLAACRTGVHSVEPGDELFGLLRGFLAAGARSVAASLWLVDDAATMRLMTYFYTELRRGQSRAAALRAAQQAIRSEYPHPYYWGAFFLTGERESMTII